MVGDAVCETRSTSASSKRCSSSHPTFFSNQTTRSWTRRPVTRSKGRERQATPPRDDPLRVTTGSGCHVAPLRGHSRTLAQARALRPELRLEPLLEPAEQDEQPKHATTNGTMNDQ